MISKGISIFSLCSFFVVVLAGCTNPKTEIVTHSSAEFKLVTEIPADCCFVSQDNLVNELRVSIQQAEDVLASDDYWDGSDSFSIYRTSEYSETPLNDIAQDVKSRFRIQNLDLIDVQEVSLAGGLPALRIIFLMHDDLSVGDPIYEYRERIYIKFPDFTYVIVYSSPSKDPDSYFFKEVYTFALENLRAK